MKNGSALDGIKVLDMGRVLAGPYCSSILADLGAEVIKIEMPEGGDSSRENLPKKDGISTYFVNFNRSKKGITLNLKSTEGKEIFKKLIIESDVIVENFRPGVMNKMNLGYEELNKINPKIIYAAISGFGQEGPYADRAGFDPIAQAMSGIMSITGHAGESGVRCGASIADIMAGQNAALAICAALQYRNKTGKGQMIDVALTDVAIMATASVAQVYLTTENIPTPLGNGYAASAPGNSYPTKDGYVILLTVGDSQWRKLCKILGHIEWIDIPEFKDNEMRVKNKKKLDLVISSETIKFETDELVTALLQVGLPGAPIMNIAQVAADKHFQGVREMFTSIEHPILGTVKITNQSFKMSETNPYVRSCSPELGEHNNEIYNRLGYSDEEIHRLIIENII